MKDFILIVLIYILGIGALFVASEGYTDLGAIMMMLALVVVIFMLVKAYKSRKSIKS